MFLEVDTFIREAVHNLINLSLFPEHHLRLGQFDHCRFCDAEVVWERTGNLYSGNQNTVTYCYYFDRPDFALRTIAIWTDDQSTADIKVVAVTPDNEGARKALRDWLARTVTGSWAPYD